MRDLQDWWPKGADEGASRATSLPLTAERNLHWHYLQASSFEALLGILARKLLKSGI